MPSISIPTALMVSGGLAAAGGVAQGVMGADAASRASRTQAAASERAIDFSTDMWEGISGLLDPFISAGAGAIDPIKALMGMGPEGAAGMQSALEATPGYKFTLDQGMKAAQSGFASQGLAESGPAIKGAINYAEGLAGTTYQQRLQDFFGLMGAGQNAATNKGQLALGFSGDISNLITGKGQAQASGIVGEANAINSGIGNFTNSVGNSALMLGLNGAGMFGQPRSAASPSSTPQIPYLTPSNAINPLTGRPQ